MNTRAKKKRWNKLPTRNGQRKPTGEIFKCSFCSTKFYIPRCLLKKYHPRFCSVNCRKNGFSIRFWEKVHKTPGCWEWMGSFFPDGYGQISKGKGVGLRAHRVAYELKRNKIPKGLCVLHQCDNPRCVNPSHLFLGTFKDNWLDAIRKGRATQHLWHGADGKFTSQRPA